MSEHDDGYIDLEQSVNRLTVAMIEDHLEGKHDADELDGCPFCERHRG
jgi:hypothetical protein